jgi:hypothetical protein
MPFYVKRIRTGRLTEVESDDGGIAFALPSTFVRVCLHCEREQPTAEAPRAPCCYCRRPVGVVSPACACHGCERRRVAARRAAAG